MKTLEEKILEIIRSNYNFLSGINDNKSAKEIANYITQRESKYRELYEAMNKLIKIQATWGTVGDVMETRQRISDLESELNLNTK